MQMYGNAKLKCTIAWLDYATESYRLINCKIATRKYAKEALTKSNVTMSIARG